MKTLRIWNGRGHGKWTRGGSFYIGAYSRRQAARLLCKACGHPEDDFWIGRYSREMKGYYAEGCWGNAMEGIAPELGLWATKSYNEKPVRIL